MKKEGSGYVKNQMSVNASIAHSNNVLPLSKWRKPIFVEELEFLTDKKVKNIKGSYKNFLEYSEWHHTGLLYSITKFYKVNEEKVSEAIKNGEIIFYTEKEEDEIFQKELQEIEARKEEIEARKEEEKKQEEIEIAELKTANKFNRITKKGATITVAEISVLEQPNLYNKLVKGLYIPIKELGNAININNIIELKLI